MRIGISYRGFLGDFKLDWKEREVSSPDGNASYLWALIYRLVEARHEVYMMQEDLDVPAIVLRRDENFSSFSCFKRNVAYSNMIRTGGYKLPELDLLLLEWRFPIPGRNCEYRVPLANERLIEKKVLSGELQPDLWRQTQLLNHYKGKNTKIVIWDLDHKLTAEDEYTWQPDAILETSQRPRELTKPRIKVEPPFIVDDILSVIYRCTVSIERDLAYIGSRYERDDVIDEWIKPASEKCQISFYGNWLGDKDSKERWPNIDFQHRVSMRSFRKIYMHSAGVPLLAKKSYLETGFITPRPIEALLFGSIPVGLSSHLGVVDYVLEKNIAENSDHLVEIANRLRSLSYHKRFEERKKNAEKLYFMDASYFVKTLERILEVK